MLCKYDIEKLFDIYQQEIELGKIAFLVDNKNTWTKDMLDLLMEFIQKDDRAVAYRGMDWSEEYYLAEHGDPNDTQSAL